MKTLNALLCCLTLIVAPLAVAQTQKPPAKPPAAPEKPGVRPVVELRQSPRHEACQKQASERKLSGEARETFLSSCLK